MLLTEFDYNLTPEMIAQSPVAERDTSRLLVLNRHTGGIDHRHFGDLIEYLRPDDLLVMNNTQVTALRLRGEKLTGAKAGSAHASRSGAESLERDREARSPSRRRNEDQLRWWIAGRGGRAH